LARKRQRALEQTDSGHAKARRMNRPPARRSSQVLDESATVPAGRWLGADARAAQHDPCTANLTCQRLEGEYGGGRSDAMANFPVWPTPSSALRLARRRSGATSCGTGWGKFCTACETSELRSSLRMTTFLCPTDVDEPHDLTLLRQPGETFHCSSACVTMPTVSLL
jgi:hypothetical protein